MNSVVSISNYILDLIRQARDTGKTPSVVTVSYDTYQRWQAQNNGVEPVTIDNLPIEIRDGYKPGIIAILGERQDL